MRLLPYDDLAEEAKDTAIENLGDINMDYDWWQPTVEDVRDMWLEEYGINFEVDTLCFDLGRGRVLYFGRSRIWVEDQERLLSVLAPTIALELVLDKADFPFNFSFATHHYGGGNGRTILELDDYRDAEAPPEFPVDIEEWFDDLCRDFWRELDKEYDHLTSREAIEEFIRANEFRFTNDGRLERR